MVWIGCWTPGGYYGIVGNTRSIFPFGFETDHTERHGAKQKPDGAHRLLWFNCAAIYILISYSDSQLKLGYYYSTFFSELRAQPHEYLLIGPMLLSHHSVLVFDVH